MSREWRIYKDADKFQKIASGVYSIFLIIAISLGGGWTYFTFNTELRVQNATAQLEKLNRDLAQGRLVRIRYRNAADSNRLVKRAYFNWETIGKKYWDRPRGFKYERYG